MRHRTWKKFVRLDSKSKKAIRRFYKGICQYCGTSGADHVDHIIPKSRGGADSLENYILACAKCNMRKGAGEIAPQYLALITSIADKNKDNIRRSMRTKKDYTIWKVGHSRLFYDVVVLHDKPTIGEYCALMDAHHKTDEFRRALDAKSEEQLLLAARKFASFKPRGTDLRA